ncbi:MAG: TatD family hydrolase [Bacteroidetes bacterium]|nr:TatD family hydrolase [Bacteroidota bacterium]
MVLTDTHTHLYAGEFDEDRGEMLKRAIDNGINRLFLPNIDSGSVKGMLTLVEKYPQNCFPMMGLHPCSVKENYETELRLVEKWLSGPEVRFYAVGEIGLDLYWDVTFFEQQKQAFRKQIELALQYRLPIVIHVRKAFNETIEIVREYAGKGLKGIFHCFSGTMEEAERVVSLGGFKLGIGGVVTFKNRGLNEVIPHVALEHLVLETDSPYLAPVPYRGKRNESGYLTIIAEKVAGLKNCSIEEVAEQTTKNSIDIFGV